jgi:hypothetical protein
MDSLDVLAAYRANESGFFIAWARIMDEVLAAHARHEKNSSSPPRTTTMISVYPVTLERVVLTILEMHNVE